MKVRRGPFSSACSSGKYQAWYFAGNRALKMAAFIPCSIVLAIFRWSSWVSTHLAGLGRDDVDPARVALLGCSQAGYWVPRAAAFERRLAAAIVDPGVVDVATSWLAHLPQPLIDLYRSGDRESFEAALEQGDVDPATRAMGAKRMEPYDSDSMYDILVELEKWDLTDVAARVECPTLIIDPEDEQFWPGQSSRLHDLLECPKTLLRFTAAEGANQHCEPMAPILRSHRVLDWLDETLGRMGSAPPEG